MFENLFFVTTTTVEWIPIFRRPKFCQAIIEPLKFLVSRNSIKLHDFVIMDNHIHFIATSEDIRNAVKSLKMFSAKQVVGLLENESNSWLLNQLSYHKKDYKIRSKYQVWQEGSNVQQIFHPEVYSLQSNYVSQNPVKAGFVLHKSHWLYSSASGRFDDILSPVEIVQEG